MEKGVRSSAAYLDSKPHYALLDGLRGVAALMVVWYHVFEGFAFAEGTSPVEGFNHGYLGVDFFFMLSGFVISYAYDDRWQASSAAKLTVGSFFRRRLIRLHPMLVMGALIGCVTYLLQGCVQWDGTEVSLGRVLLALLLALFFIPAWPGASYDVRGNGEMFPLNGPSWSLFFEYIGNIVYALLLRRLSNCTLAGVVLATGIAWAYFAVADVSAYGMVGVGWTLDTMNLIGGMLRMMFPFTLGMLMARHFKPIRVRGIFWISSALLCMLFAVPYIPAMAGVHLNGVYEMVCIMLVFPCIVWLAASGATTDRFSSGMCNWLGNLSYPLYIVHYPVMYLFYAWLIDNKVYTLSEAWPMVVGICAVNVLLAQVCLKCYDEPVRRWLARHWK
ncbi:MAG: acyltransferase [Bacteroidaceae bacterium]|nr:acyltransferase [Bacteroidaceae bacterium]